jgi:hypothetical protein
MMGAIFRAGPAVLVLQARAANDGRMIAAQTADFLRARLAAVRAKAVGLAWTKVLVQSHSAVKDEAFPLEVPLGVLLQVFQNSALQLENFLKTLAMHLLHGLFAADAARTAY